MEPVVGFEPTTDGLQIHATLCATATRTRIKPASIKPLTPLHQRERKRQNRAPKRTSGVAICCTGRHCHRGASRNASYPASDSASGRGAFGHGWLTKAFWLWE